MQGAESGADEARTMNKPSWHGIFPAVTTKFHADESIDAAGTAWHIDFQIRNGIHGLVTCGSLGEASTLTLEEKLGVAKIALDAAAGRVAVLANISETSTRDALRYVEAGNKLGVAGYMLMPSVIYPCDAREAMAHVRAVAAASAVPLMIYNNPVAYRTDLKPEHMAELADCQAIRIVQLVCFDQRGRGDAVTRRNGTERFTGRHHMHRGACLRSLFAPDIARRGRQPWADPQTHTKGEDQAKERASHPAVFWHRF